MTDPKDPADPNVNPGGDDGKTPTVPRSTYDATVTEAKAAKVRAQAAEAQLAQIAAEKKAAEEADALKRGEYEKVAKDKQAEADALKAELAKVKADRVEARKLGTFLKALGGELSEDFYPLIDLDKIKTDAEGNVDATSLKEYGDQFKVKYAVAIGKPGANTPPATKPGGMGGTGLSVDEWKALPLKERQARLGEVVQSQKKK